MTDVIDVIIKPMSKINRQEYILYHWIDVTAQGDEPPVMLRGRMRTPEDAVRAEVEFEVWIKAFHHASQHGILFGQEYALPIK